MAYYNFSIIWISWEDHRRSKEIASSLNAELILISSKKNNFLRYVYNIYNTLKVLYNNRKSIIIVQNPSRILAALATLLKLFWKFPLIVDRHTNFRIDKGISLNPFIWFVILCSEFSIRYADLTIVTNEYLKNIVEKKGGRGFVLPDKIPTLSRYKFNSINLSKNQYNILFICSFSPDEPVYNVLHAAKLLTNHVNIYITGDFSKYNKNIINNAPSNIYFTGYIPENDYFSYLNSCDSVMAFTSAEYCLICGGYEALAANKPLITSNTNTLIEFFGNSVVYCNHEVNSIKSAIKYILYNKEVYQEKMKQAYIQKSEDWNSNFKELTKIISELAYHKLTR